jgi:hypothetical protein
VDGVGHFALLLSSLKIWRRRRRGGARPEAGGDLLESVARCDLRPAAPIREPFGAGLHHHTRGGSLGPKPLKPRRVDRLERQRGLKPLAGCRVEITCGLQRPLAIEVRAVALEAEGVGLPRAGPSHGEPTLQSHPLQSLAASLTQRFRAFAFELPARETNPFMLSNLGSFGRHVSNHVRQFKGCP